MSPSSDEEDSGGAPQEPPTEGGAEPYPHAGDEQQVREAPPASEVVGVAAIVKNAVENEIAPEETPRLAPHSEKSAATDKKAASTSKKHRLSPFSTSTDIDPNGKILEESAAPAAVSRTFQLKDNFPMKLYEMLSNPDNHQAISWMPHGRSWKVWRKDLFMLEVCEKYFSQTRFQSFIRQANGWGFRRIKTDGPDRNSYYHELFLRGKPELMENMRRLLPGEKAADERADPDFRSMSSMPEIPYEFNQDPPKYGKNEKASKKPKIPYGGGYGPVYDSRWYAVMPPPPPPESGPYTFSYPPDYHGYRLPPPPPLDFSGWPQQRWNTSQGAEQSASPTQQEQDPPGMNGMSSPSNGIPPFDPSLYFPPYYPHYPPPQVLQASNKDEDRGANDEFQTDVPDDQMPPMPTPYFNYPYPPYPPRYHGDMQYTRPAEGEPSSTANLATYHYQFGTVPPPLWSNPTVQGIQNDGGCNTDDKQKDSVDFSPIQRPDESLV